MLCFLCVCVCVCEKVKGYKCSSNSSSRSSSRNISSNNSNNSCCYSSCYSCSCHVPNTLLTITSSSSTRFKVTPHTRQHSHALSSNMPKGLMYAALHETGHTWLLSPKSISFSFLLLPISFLHHLLHLPSSPPHILYHHFSILSSSFIASFTISFAVSPQRKKLTLIKWKRKQDAGGRVTPTACWCGIWCSDAKMVKESRKVLVLDILRMIIVTRRKLSKILSMNVITRRKI